MKLSGVKYLTDQGIENIWKNKMMAFATFCVLLISLLLVGISGLFYININSIINGIGGKNEIAVFLNNDTSPDRVGEFGSQLSAIDAVGDVVYVSKEQALSSMTASMPDYNVIFESLEGDNPLPDGYRIKVKNYDDVASVVAQISAMPDVKKVNASYDFVDFLRQLRKILTVIAGAIIIALVVVSMIMISNTTKASVFARREEIQIMKYVGATDGFIRTPFFVEGMVTGAFSGIGAFVLTWFGYRAVYKIIFGQVELMNVIGVGSLIPFSDIQIYVGAAYIAAGAFVGAIGSVFCTRRHIDV